MREIASLTAGYDPPPPHRFGVISLASDTVSSDEIRAMTAGPGRVLLETRIANEDAISAATLRAMEGRITDAAGRLPGGLPYDAVAFLCTSASMLIGFDGVAGHVRAAVPAAPVTNPMSAAISAMQAIGARRIGLVTPYVADVTERIAACFEDHGVTISRAASFFVPSDALVARIDGRSLSAAAAAVAPGADAVFLSCTALRTATLNARIEAGLGLPVTSSNQVTAWDLLRLSRLRPAPGDWGRLFDRAPPEAMLAPEAAALSR